MEHTDLEKYKLIVEPSLFRNRPAPIAMEDKKNDLEQKDVQQKISNAEMKNEQTIDYVTLPLCESKRLGKLGDL